MVKKASKSKTKSQETVEEKIEELATEVPKKESVPQVMQVVEVMDEENEVLSKEEGGETVEPEILKSEEESTEIAVETAASQEEEKKQDVVSEFFAKKEQPSTVGYPDITVHKKSIISGVFLWALGVILLVVGIGAVIIFTSRGSMKMPSFAIKPSPTPTIAPAPTAVPTPVIDKTILKIQVLNGSGTAGEAGKMKTLLEEKGYTVVGTGNAKTYDYEKTEIQSISTQEAVLGVLSTDLAGSYTVGSTAATLKDTLPYNILVIVGKE